MVGSENKARLFLSCFGFTLLNVVNHLIRNPFCNKSV
jgi:hypothetical protein